MNKFISEINRLLKELEDNQVLVEKYRNTGNIKYLLGWDDCSTCEGTGIMTTQNGPDDFDRDICFCQTQDQYDECEEVDTTFPYENSMWV